MVVRQLKGMKHAKLIKRRAKKMWRACGAQSGAWDACLRQAIEEHRLKIEAEIISKNVENQLALASFQCDNNGWVG